MAGRASRLTPRTGAGALAIGRIALGAAVLLAPETVTSRWLGGHARHPAVRYLARSLGARDLALGILVISTLDDPKQGPRAQAMCALADAVDALATVAAREELPVAGVIGTITVAGAAAGAGVYFARELARA
jgi:hypothetical protein